MTCGELLNCFWCEEPILPHEVVKDMPYLQAHRECGARSALGSVAHIERRCGCYIKGSTDNDDPTLTKREAAKAALKAFLALRNS